MSVHLIESFIYAVRRRITKHVCSRVSGYMDTDDYDLRATTDLVYSQLLRYTYMHIWGQIVSDFAGINISTSL